MEIQLKMIFDELCKGNSSILTFENIAFISDTAVYLFNKSRNNESFSDTDINSLKYLIMICNVTYNRTDGIILPVEDGVYDILNEKYKSIDPNFQVGSAVVQFKSMAEKQLEKEGKVIIQPFVMIEQPKNTDEISLQFREEIQSFDNHKYRFEDVFYDKGNFEYDMNISKRTHNTAHSHPELVGTLDKAKFILNQDAIDKDVFDDPNVSVLERDFFGKHIMMGIISPEQELDLVIELKYDGISVEADCTDIVTSARTRGDTGAGLASDITPMLYGYKFTRNNVLKDRTVGVKFEAIMTKTDLDKFNIARQTTYANCRTAIIGLFGASDANKYRDFITLVPLALDRKDVPEISNRMEEIELLNKLYKTKGEPLRHVYIHGNYQTCLYLIKKFAEEAKYARNYLDFMFDGIVVSYLDENIRQRLGRENFVNKYSMAVKFDPMVKMATFLGYEYMVGKTGNICPLLWHSPVEFLGSIHQKSSISSYARFKELALKKGDVVNVTYTNDVLCYIDGIDCEHNRTNTAPLEEFPEVCPVCGTRLVFSDSGKTASCPNFNCEGRRVARMSDMLKKMNVKGFSDSTIYQLGIYSFHELMNVSEQDIQIIGPTNAYNLVTALNELRTTPQDDYKIIGSLGFTGLSSRKWKLLLSSISIRDLIKLSPEDLIITVSNIKGLGQAAAETICNELPIYMEDIEYIINNMNIIDSSSMALSNGKSIRFTGTRDYDLEALLKSMGHDADCKGTVTKDTDILIVPYEGFTSTKTGKVSDDCIIVSLDEFKVNMNKYLQ